MRNKGLRRTSLVASFAALAVAACAAPIATAEATVELSKETTFITSPLADDGLPNYAQAIMDRQSAGVTHENNGAVIFWQAMGPVGVNDEDFKLICDALDVDPQSCLPCFDGPRTDAFKQRLIDWLKTKDTSLSSASAAGLSQQIVSAISEGRLSASNVPPVVAWLQANEQRLDSLVAASMRPHFYSPSPTFLEDRSSELSLAQLPDAEQLRSAACALALRANRRLSNNEPAAAWKDILAMWRLGKHANRGLAIVNLLVGISLRECAGQTTLAILQSPDISTPLLQQIKTDLSVLDQSADLLPIMDFGERCVALDLTLRLFFGRLGGLNVQDADALDRILTLDFDASEVLRLINEWCDRIANVARDKEPRRRLTIKDRLFDELSKSVPIATESLNRGERSLAIGNALAYYLLDPLDAGFKAQSRDEARLRLLRVAVELAIHRSQTGEYPTTLDELAIDDSTLLDDPFTDGRLVYQRRKDGYLLYSLFENGADDSGSDAYHPIVEGEWIATDDDSYTRDSEKSDLVIRLPLPPFELPLQQSAKDEAE